MGYLLQSVREGGFAPVSVSERSLVTPVRCLSRFPAAMGITASAPLLHPRIDQRSHCRTPCRDYSPRPRTPQSKLLESAPDQLVLPRVRRIFDGKSPQPADGTTDSGREPASAPPQAPIRRWFSAAIAPSQCRSAGMGRTAVESKITDSKSGAPEDGEISSSDPCRWPSWLSSSSYTVRVAEYSVSFRYGGIRFGDSKDGIQ